MTQYGIFLFFAGWVIVMTLFVMLIVPETKNIPLVRIILLCTLLRTHDVPWSELSLVYLNATAGQLLCCLGICMQFACLPLVPPLCLLPHAQEEMHLVWAKHWAWKRWAADKRERHHMSADVAGTKPVEHSGTKVAPEDFAVAPTNGKHANGVKDVI